LGNKMQKKLTLSLCLKKSLIDLSLFRGKEKVLGKCDPIFQFSDPNNEKSIDKAQNFLIATILAQSSEFKSTMIINNLNHY